jgi:hypothetical protein
MARISDKPPARGISFLVSFFNEIKIAYENKMMINEKVKKTISSAGIKRNASTAINSISPIPI